MRKISATSSGGRTRIVAFHQQSEILERTRHRTDRLGGDAGVERGGVQLGVSEQNLDDANVDILLEQVSGKAVPQRVRTDTFLDAGSLRCLMDGPIELARRDGLESVPTGKQPNP